MSTVPPTPTVTPLLVAEDIKFYYSGGTFNSDPNQSLGGEISATEYVSGTLNGLFDRVESNEAVLGDVEFRCVYIKNTHLDRTLLGAKVWIEAGTPSNTTAISISVGAGGTNGEEILIPDENIFPTTQTFETILEEPVSANIGDLGPGDYIALWVRYFIAPDTVTTANDIAIIRIDGEREPEPVTAVPPVVCGTGTHYNEVTHVCDPDPITCPANTHYSPTTGTCIPDAPAGTFLPNCPVNYHYDNALNLCVPNTGAPPTVAVLKFAAAGDYDCVANTTATFNRMIARLPTTGAVDQLGLVFPLGDLSYASTEDCFITLCQTMGSSMFPNQFFPVIGDFDDLENGSTTKRQQIINTFPNIPTQGYYAFTRGNIRFIGMDTQISYVAGSAQHTFVMAELAAAAGNPAIKWKIVFYHKPSLISAVTQTSVLTDFRLLYHPVFDAYHVDVVLTAHANVYSRTLPVKHNAANPAQPIVVTTPSIPAPPPQPVDCPSGQHRDPITNLCVPDTIPPPTTGGQVDSNGILWKNATGTGGVIPQSRDEAADDRWSENYTQLRQYGFEVTTYCTFQGTNSSSHMALKHWGSNHSGANVGDHRWYDTGIRVNGDVQLQWEGPHPNNHDFTLTSSQQFITNIGTDMEGNTIGLKWQVFPVTPGGSAVNGGMHLRMWCDTDGFNAQGRPQNNWRLCYDFIDTGTIIDPTNYAPLDDMEIEVRQSDTDSQTMYAGGVHFRRFVAGDNP